MRSYSRFHFRFVRSISSVSISFLCITWISSAEKVVSDPKTSKKWFSRPCRSLRNPHCLNALRSASVFLIFFQASATRVWLFVPGSKFFRQSCCSKWDHFLSLLLYFSYFHNVIFYLFSYIGINHRRIQINTLGRTNYTFDIICLERISPKTCNYDLIAINLQKSFGSLLRVLFSNVSKRFIPDKNLSVVHVPLWDPRALQLSCNGSSFSNLPQMKIRAPSGEDLPLKTMWIGTFWGFLPRHVIWNVADRLQISDFVCFVWTDFAPLKWTLLITCMMGTCSALPGFRSIVTIIHELRNIRVAIIKARQLNIHIFVFPSEARPSSCAKRGRAAGRDGVSGI